METILFFTIFLILSCPTVISTTTTTAVKPGRLAVELIHRNSPLSPFYNPSTTVYDRAGWALQSSIKRHAILSAKQRNASTEAIRGEISPDSDGGEFLAKLSIGTPGVEAYYILDTGSDLLWTQCQPCIECFKQPGPIYDPFKSTTYESITCGSEYCFELPENSRGCDGFSRCTYAYIYADGSSSLGVLGYESITFGAVDKNVSTITVTDVAFGCGNQNNNSIPGGDAGILGLSVSNLSLISQVSHIYKKRFSYCFSNISDTNSKGHLVLGDGALIDGNTTPLTIGRDDGLYYLTLEDISVSDTRLGIEPGTFDLKPNGTGGLVIDTGTQYTHLAMDGYIKLKNALIEELSVYEVTEAPDPEELERMCFDGVVDSDLGGFPTVTFHFKGGADVVLDLWGIFVQANEDVFCMAFLSVNVDSLSIFGNLAQQFHNVGYDLENKVISFKMIDCSTI
ncbi:hypothetical protein HHK36_002119 [Tetracentron sinense]|uniref:Peptidase A1 domain-containing protein n=1 Tax=Tetracentron sinense TaxID=13715 RepID=A0A834ZYG9_TETSI|nr:hypothetical protein HHK36_002119 [Tetracentron sinense]